MKKKLNALNLETLNIDIVEYKTIYDFIKKENYIQYLYDMCFLNQGLFNKYLLEYRNNNYENESLSKEDMEMLFAIKSVKEIYNNYKEILNERISD